MSLDRLSLYHRLPPPARSAAATLRGLYLLFWRYGPQTQRLAVEAAERECWSPRQWEDWQQERLALVLRRAVTQVPYYRRQWERRRRDGDRASWEYLENWPILTKEDLRAAPAAFVADDVDRRNLFRETTSGTSGTPVKLWSSRATIRSWYALCEARIRMWHGVTREDRWAMLGGQLVTPFVQKRPPFWVWNAALKQLYMSSYHLAPQNVGYYLEAMASYQVKYALGYASSLDALSRTAMEKGISAPRLRVVVSNAEPLYDHQRERAAKVFRCPVRDTYGMTELACAASECQEGTLHLWPEVGKVEVMDDDRGQQVPAGMMGRFVCTSLLNLDMPLVRYEVGDRGALAPDAAPCACGRSLPSMKGVEGRLDDVVITRDGRRIGRLDPVFKGDLHIREAQIIQEDFARIRVRFVSTSDYCDRDGLDLVRRMRERVGDMDIVLEPTDYIPRSSNGKFRAVVSKVSASRAHSA